ncbi:hypothetical protein G7046_g6674 [Stylonectria norvegica]|nr:hypothetical protein G7046_g6674 [Stylonectria norvegica]
MKVDTTTSNAGRPETLARHRDPESTAPDDPRVVVPQLKPKPPHHANQGKKGLFDVMGSLAYYYYSGESGDGFGAGHVAGPGGFGRGPPQRSRGIPAGADSEVYDVDGHQLTVAVAVAPHGPFGIMEQIETQVSDLRYLSQAPAATPSGSSSGPVAAYETPQPNVHQPPTSPGSASVGDNSAPSVGASNANNKRKSVDEGSMSGKQTRSKRNRVSCFVAAEIEEEDVHAGDAGDDTLRFLAVPCILRCVAFRFDALRLAMSSSYAMPMHPVCDAASMVLVSSTVSLRIAISSSPVPILSLARCPRRINQADHLRVSLSQQYISIACNECKRRKIKCNGETPCQRCGNLNLNCLYAPNCCSNNFKDSDDFKLVTNQIGRLQDEVNWLHQNVKVLQSDPNRLAPLGDRPLHIGSSTVAASPAQSSSSLNRVDLTHSRYGSFRGPTSMAYSLDVANSTISNMGYRGINGDGDDHGGPADDVGLAMNHGPSDPLLDFDKDEMVRLCRLHDEEIGIMYPVINVQTVITHAKNLSTFLETSRNQRSIHMLNDEKTMQLKIIMCCALVVEEHGHSEKAIRLYNSMENVLNRKLMAEASEVASLPLLALVAGYRFLSNDEVLAWRVMGQVARLCLELGIHQRTGLMKIQDEEERKNALNSFWSAYVLDRRWAFGTGLPFVVQDEEIDAQLPFPDEYPYLVAMITYSRIGAKVWRQVSHFGPVLARDLRQAEIENLDQDILQWYEIVPEEVKVRNWDKEKQMTSTPSYNLQRLRIWTYLRLNQMRIWLYTPVLHSATSIMANPVQSQRVVDLAKDTIRYLSHLNSTTNLYRRVQVFYHQFLTSAIAVVFLASVHAPVRFSAVCREEFYIGLELVKDLSAKSWVSQRLWRTIRSLKDVAPRFGLNPEDDPQSTAALGMIGLARGHMDPNNNNNNNNNQGGFQKPNMPGQQSPPDSGAHNGARLQSEMSRMFEGYVGLNGFQFGSNEEVQQQQQNPDMQTSDTGGVYGADGTVFAQFREMY